METIWISTFVKWIYCLLAIFFFSAHLSFSVKANMNVSSYHEEKNAGRQVACGGSITWLVVKGVVVGV